MKLLKPEDMCLKPTSLKDQVILITGTSQGLGRTLALEAARAGATLILLGRKLKALEQLYDEIVALGCEEPAIQPLQLLQLTPEDAENLAKSIQDLFGRCDALIHNAGTYGQICPLLHLPPHRWQEVIHLNLNIPYLLTHALLPLLNQNKTTHILFTIANESFHPKAYWSAYSASKMGLLGLASALHEELVENTRIHVNCINPGQLRTALRLNTYPGIDPNCFLDPKTVFPYYRALLGSDLYRGQYLDLQEMALAHQQKSEQSITEQEALP